MIRAPPSMPARMCFVSVSESLYFTIGSPSLPTRTSPPSLSRSSTPTPVVNFSAGHRVEVLAAGLPGQEGQDERRVHRPGLVLDPVALAVEVGVLVGVARLHRADPGLDVLVEDAPDDGDRVQAQVLADVAVLQPRALEQRRRVQRSRPPRRRRGR
jgi:hypothetical protein